MFHWLKRHPVPIRAEFEYTLVLTYALPAERLYAFVPPGLRIDEWNGLGFLAVAFVQTRRLRPTFLPSFLGQDFFLSGYRVFARYHRPDGRELRGLKILRSDANSPLMVRFGNLLTHYNYHLVDVETERSAESLKVRIESVDGRGDVSIRADLCTVDGFLPSGSPFSSEREARRFTGPMPYTFHYEQETHSIVRIEGVRKQWRPRLIGVTVNHLHFLEQEVFSDVEPVLASCFYIEGVDYLWRRGIRELIRTPESREMKRR